MSSPAIILRQLDGCGTPHFPAEVDPNPRFMNAQGSQPDQPSDSGGDRRFISHRCRDGHGRYEHLCALGKCELDDGLGVRDRWSAVDLHELGDLAGASALDPERAIFTRQSA